MRPGRQGDPLQALLSAKPPPSCRAPARDVGRRRVRRSRRELPASTGLTLGPLFRIDEGDLGIFGTLVFSESDGDEDGLAPFCRPRERYDRRSRRRVTRTTCVVPESRQAIIRLTYTVAG